MRMKEYEGIDRYRHARKVGQNPRRGGGQYNKLVPCLSSGHAGRTRRCRVPSGIVPSWLTAAQIPQSDAGSDTSLIFLGLFDHITAEYQIKTGQRGQLQALAGLEVQGGTSWNAGPGGSASSHTNKRLYSVSIGRKFQQGD